LRIHFEERQHLFGPTPGPPEKTGLPDGIFSDRESQFWKALEWKILLQFGIFCSDLVYVMAI
jgi:hypothetical protein